MLYMYILHFTITYAVTLSNFSYYSFEVVGFPLIIIIFAAQLICLTLIHILLAKRSSIFIIGSISYCGMNSWKSHLYSLALSSSTADSIWGWPKRNRLSQSCYCSESFWLLVSSWESSHWLLWSFWSTTWEKSVETPLKNLCRMLARMPFL